MHKSLPRASAHVAAAPTNGPTYNGKETTALVKRFLPTDLQGMIYSLYDIGNYIHDKLMRISFATNEESNYFSKQKRLTQLSTLCLN